MMDEIKRETSEGERLVSLQAPNKEVMSYYTPVSHQHPVHLVSLQHVFVCVQPRNASVDENVNFYLKIEMKDQFIH